MYNTFYMHCISPLLSDHHSPLHFLPLIFALCHSCDGTWPANQTNTPSERAPPLCHEKLRHKVSHISLPPLLYTTLPLTLWTTTLPPPRHHQAHTNCSYGGRTKECRISVIGCRWMFRKRWCSRFIKIPLEYLTASCKINVDCIREGALPCCQNSKKPPTSYLKEGFQGSVQA